MNLLQRRERGRSREKQRERERERREEIKGEREKERVMPVDRNSVTEGWIERNGGRLIEREKEILTFRQTVSRYISLNLISLFCSATCLQHFRNNPSVIFL